MPYWPKPLAGGAHFDVLGRPIEIVDGDVYLRRGRDAEAKGQPEVAKVFYRRAAKIGNATAKQIAGERLAMLERKGRGNNLPIIRA